MGMRIILLSLIMVLAPVVMGEGSVFAVEHQHAKAVYTCPMHPDYISDKPGSCPICGMDLVKKEQSQEPISSGVRINADQQQLIGVKAEKVLRRPLVLSVRASARVVLDKEFYDAQTEYLGSSLIAAKRYNTSRQKLLNLGMSVDEIESLRKKRWVARDIILMDLTGKVWVYASVYENEMGLVKPGQKVTLTAVAFPGEIFEGVVAGVAQQIDPQSRTARTRIHVDDAAKRLRPEMFMAADIKVELGEKLSVPEEAVLDSGRRKIVHVMTGDETFSAREVVLGHKASGFYEVISGLHEGEKVVVAGNFLVDAESQLKGNYDRKDN